MDPVVRYNETRQYMLCYYILMYGILWYDWASLLVVEYRKIWRGRVTPAKVLYVLNRYALLATTIFVFTGFRLSWTVVKCNKYLIGWEAALPIISSAGASGLLLIRCHVVWGKQKAMLAALLALFSAQLSGQIYLASQWLTTLPRPPELVSGPCIPFNSSDKMQVFCILPLCYDSIISFLFIWRTIDIRKTFPASTNATLLDAIIKHGALYAIATALANFANLAFVHISYRYVHTPLASYGGGYICYILGSIFASRLMFSLKREDETDSTTKRSGSLPYAGRTASRPDSTKRILGIDYPLQSVSVSTSSGRDQKTEIESRLDYFDHTEVGKAVDACVQTTPRECEFKQACQGQAKGFHTNM